MVEGLQRFRDHFRDDSGDFVIIGGVACDEWFESQGLTFRATRDIDIVLMIESPGPISPGFVERWWEFINAGEYEAREKLDGSRICHRFVKPQQVGFPAMLELFSRTPDAATFDEGQVVLRIPEDGEAVSLSAILMDEVYYQLIRDHAHEVNGLRFAGPEALIPLKAAAWLDLSERSGNGESVKARDIRKHRNDVFHLAATLPNHPGPDLDDSIRADLRRFLADFPAESGDWQAIGESLRSTLGGAAVMDPGALIDGVSTYFSLHEGR